MSYYASDTTVPVERTRAEIETVLRKYGATKFFASWDDFGAVIGFQCADRLIRFQLKLPEQAKFRKSSTGRVRSSQATEKAWEQGCRQRWRALLLTIKAKLESVACGIETFDEAFLAHVVMPGGESLGRHLLPQIDEAYKTGQMPTSLLQLGHDDARRNGQEVIAGP